MNGYQRISRYKAHLMGIAVLIVVYGHLLYYHSGLRNYEDLNFTEWYTLGSVEMFLFVSGFGIFQSLRRSREAGAFYLRRLGRLLPSYLPVMAAWCGVNLLKGRMHMSHAVGNLTAMGWWFQTEHQFNWYVPAILVLYLLSPVFYDCIDRKKTHWCMIALVLLNIAGWRSNLLMALSRFPTYLLGMYFGARYADGRSPSKREVVLWSVAGVAAMAAVPYFFLVGRRYLWFYGMYWNLFFVSTPMCMFLTTWCLEKHEGCALGRGVNRALSFLGTCSFEIYLCHLALFDCCLKLGVRGWPRWICLAVLGTGIGIAYHYVVEAALARWRRRQRAAA